VKNLRKLDKDDPERRKLEKDIEEENGGPGVYNFDLKKNYLLSDPDWKHDKIPEVWNGKNVYDFVDPDIEAKLAALEEEEEKLDAEGFYESDESVEDAEEAEIRMKAELIRERREQIRNASRMRKSLKNRALIPRSAKALKLSEMEKHLDSIGYDAGASSERVREQSRGRTATRSEADFGDGYRLDWRSSTCGTATGQKPRPQPAGYKSSHGRCHEHHDPLKGGAVGEAGPEEEQPHGQTGRGRQTYYSLAAEASGKELPPLSVFLSLVFISTYIGIAI
jgi:hypothetical protein